jgi:protein O-mannosyl-transferase
MRVVITSISMDLNRFSQAVMTSIQSKTSDSPPEEFAVRDELPSGQVPFLLNTIGVLGRTLPPILILFFTMTAFLPVLLNGFVDLDDRSLVNNLYYQGLGVAQMRWMLTNFDSGFYHPLRWISFGLDYVLWWNEPFGYHLTNLLIHGSNAVIFYFVALRLVASSCPGALLTPAVLRSTAGAAALFFGIHPLRVEPVAWASARGELLAGLFFLGSLLFYLRAVSVGERERGYALWMTGSVCAYGLSLLSGTNGIALPFILLILDVYPLKRLGVGNWVGPSARRLYWQKAPYFVLAVGALAFVFAARNFDQRVATVYPAAGVTSGLYIIAAPGFYLWKGVVPLALSPFYELPRWSLVLSALTVVAISAGLFVVRKRWPAFLTGWICYLILFLLVPGGDLSGEQLLSDRQAYLASLPWALLIGSAVVHCWRAWVSGSALRWTLFARGGAITVILIGLSILTWSQAQVWHDSETLWRHAVAVGSSSRAHYSLATLFETQGKYDDAIASYRQTAKIDSRRWDAEEKAALLLQKQGKIREAVEHFRSVVQINPGATEARNNLAAGLVYEGEITEAVQQFRKVLELAPDRNDIRIKLGAILAVQGRLGEAEDLFQQVVQADPGDARTRLKLGQVFAAQGNLDRAINYFREALQIQPEDAEVRESLGRALAEQGKKNEAAEHLGEAVRILKSTPVSR